ncbi:oocyte zinc finger protein XlCOF7.1-like isoform X1 [Bufo gargarizans]|uniref:oocyte zinc finger protein XlCOF7.1-like isoform X1 n=1 Tax=Bufo gargarizans TaxID=30331 RepID=UPI001CF5C74F|nr:oocyte zinc finger protein XlCOF7.1-like isoform X1 [Bufo gargarizans]XP_044153151.1 oocyte zinc finger protein XlCOF7.1-like isoform X1 [Bufo gargarizans]XP_044153152.1 oocyte zinc finger protein XlCOF7.1-like isoform X1 [Bufo gargarizans]
MDKKQSDPTEQVLNLTLEIILLLTGEDYFVVKKSGERATNRSLQVVEGTCRVLTDVHLPLPQSMTHKPHSKQRILELTNKIIELLTEEVPIRCQDITVHFSMEEWEYLEGNKDLYKDVMMENEQPLTSLGLPTGSTNEYLPMQIQEDQYREDLTNPDIYSPTDQIQQGPSHITEEPHSCEGRSLIESTQQYPFTYVKEDPVSCNGGTLTDQNNCAATYSHALQYEFTYIEEEPSTCDGGNFKYQNNTPLDHTHRYLPSHNKDETVLLDGDSLTNPNIYEVKDHSSQCSSHVNEDPAPCRGANHYLSTYVKDGKNPDTNSPESQSVANDHISVQYSCSECKKCFWSMAELVSHQGIHTAAKLLQSGTHVFTTAIVHAPPEPPVKHKLLTCSKCGRTFYTKSSLVGHMKTHWKVNHLQNETYKCDQCGKCFLSKSLLNMHLRLHFGERPYACSTCGERFMRTCDLGKHQRKHQ